MLGSVTYQKVCQPDAPRTTAASSLSRPLASITVMTSRATYANVTNAVASAMPGHAKMTRMPCASSQPPTGERGPTASTKMSPEITGDTANGISMTAVRSVLPRKSNLPIVQPAASPNTTLAGTTTAAVARVSRTAASASVSTRARKYAGTPSRKASMSTAAIGKTTMTPRKPSATAMSATRTRPPPPDARAGLSPLWPLATSMVARSSNEGGPSSAGDPSIAGPSIAPAIRDLASGPSDQSTAPLAGG